MGNITATPVLGSTSPASLRLTSSATERWARLSSDHSVVGEFMAQGSPETMAVVRAWPSTVGGWREVMAIAQDGAEGIVVERLNKALGGFTAVSPRLDRYWRSGKSLVTCPGYHGRWALPIVIQGNPDGDGGWHWSLRTSPGNVLIPEGSTAPVHGSPKGKRAAKAVVVPSPSVTPPTAAPFPAPSPTVASPRRSAKPTRAERQALWRAKQAAAKAAAAAPEDTTITPVPSPKVMGSPAIFAEPETLANSFAVHHEATVEAELRLAAKQHKAGLLTVVKIAGPTGTGKTLTARHVAETEGLPFLKVDAAGMATFADWVGAVSLTEGSQGVVTAFAPSILLEAIRADGPYGGRPRMVLVDEVNRVPQGSALSALMPMTDGSGTVYVPDAHRSFPIDPAVMWVLTANIGSQYSGTLPIDPAILNRVTTHIEIDYPSAKAEADMIVEQGRCDRTVAEQLVRVAAQVRKASASGSIAAPGVSTRQLIRAGSASAFGASIHSACETAFVRGYSPDGGATDSEQAQVRVIVNAVLGPR